MLRGIVVLAGLAAGGALAVLRRRRAQRDFSPAPGAMAPAGEALGLPAAPPPSSPPPSAPPAAAAEPSPGDPAPAPAESPTDAPGERSREELYRQAQEIGLKGRSRMTKAQLEAALREHGR